MELDIGQIIGNFRVIDKIGSGGMGAVYRAQHLLIGNLVAVKVLHSSFCGNQDVVMRFFNEARAASSIQHPGIVSIHDFGYCQNHSAYIVMEHIKGESLDARIQSHITLPVDVALSVASQIASALAAAHGKRIIHRDLKPDNIMLTTDPDISGGERIKLLDFGVAKLVATDDFANQTQTGLILGTPTYMAPEQCAGASSVDGRADLYSLGCILYKMLCGRSPFTGRAAEVIAAHLHVVPPPPRSIRAEIPEAIDALIVRLLQKKPEDRFRSAHDLLLAMKPMLPEHHALKGFPNVPLMAKTLPYSQPGESPRLTPCESLAAVLEDDESTVMDGKPPAFPPPLPRPLPRSSMAPPPPRPSMPAPLPWSSPPALHLLLSSPQPAIGNIISGPEHAPGPSSTISRATISIANPSSDHPERWSRYLVAVAAVLAVVILSMTAVLLDSEQESTSAAAQTSAHGSRAEQDWHTRAAVADSEALAHDPDNDHDNDHANDHDNDHDNDHEASDQAGDSALVTNSEGVAGEASKEQGEPCVSIEIRSTPIEATVIRSSDQKILGPTPYAVELPCDDGGHLELVLRAPGYRDQVIRVPLAESTSRTVELHRAPDDESRSQRSARKKPRRSGPGNPYQ